MGHHVCLACKRAGVNVSAQTLDNECPASSADVRLNFVNKRSWLFPYKGLPHYVKHHNFQPPKEFVEDVMTAQLHTADVVIIESPTKVGYLEDPDLAPQGSVPDEFLEKLHKLVAQVKSGRGSGYYRQTRGR
jgi:hypothetical protein